MFGGWFGYVLLMRCLGMFGVCSEGALGGDFENMWGPLWEFWGCLVDVWWVGLGDFFGWYLDGVWTYVWGCSGDVSSNRLP